MAGLFTASIDADALARMRDAFALLEAGRFAEAESMVDSTLALYRK